MSTRPTEKSLIEVRRALQSISVRLDRIESRWTKVVGGWVTGRTVLTHPELGGGGAILTEDGLDFVGTEDEDGEGLVQELGTMLADLKLFLWSFKGVDTGWLVNEDDSGDAITYEDGAYVYWTLGGYLDQVEQRLVRDTVTRVTTTPYTIKATDEVLFIDTDGGAIEVDLPAGVEGAHYRLINVGSGANDVTVDPNGTEQIFAGGAGVAYALTDGNSITIHYNATEGWW